MRAAEAAAREAGKTLLVLDTATGGDAERLYARLGWQRVGVIPGYALWPQGGLCATTILLPQPRLIEWSSWQVAAALLSAALHAGWNAAVKSSRHPPR